MVTTVRYGNTNTYFLRGPEGGLLVDTDYAGTLQRFFRAIKAAGIAMGDITHVLCTHYHPDHMGLVGELQDLGVKLVLLDVQREAVHFSDGIFARDQKLRFRPVREAEGLVLSCEDSRGFLRSLGIGGEILPTPSHSPDSVSVLLDSGECLVGDLEPFSFLGGYDSNPALEQDWALVMQRHPRRIFYGHANDTGLTKEE